jgi:3-oxoacid CoA-transferase subunit A
MIKNWFITGDVHGRVLPRLAKLADGDWTPEETALIILGDVGFNFFLNRTDWKNKRDVQNTGYHVYCVRGNHEERPERIPGMAFAYDENVGNGVWYEPEFPNIKYFHDGGVYTIGGKRTLVIGGAYSIDKWYRLHRIGVLAEHQISRDAAAKAGWFMDELLSKYEMEKIQRIYAGDHFDAVLSHTCPLDWEPRDLFLSGIDQSKVDKSMENWMNEFKDQITWDSWLFGHFHADRSIQDGVQMLYHDILLWDDIPQKK